MSAAAWHVLPVGDVVFGRVTPRIEIFRRLPDGTWQYRDVTAGTLDVRGSVIDLETLYASLPD